MDIKTENTIDYFCLGGSLLGFVLFRNNTTLMIPALITGRLLGNIAGRKYIANKEKFMNTKITDSSITTKIQ